MIETCWHLLGIEETTDKAVIRQAYRAKLPKYHPETDPEGFKALREAYEYAMQYADSPETTIDTSLSESLNESNAPNPISTEEIQVNEICQKYQSLLDDPQRCYNIDEWHQFVASFYDYSMTVIDIVKWQLLEISYSTSHVSLSCTKVLADSLRWRQQLMTQLPDKIDRYDDFLNQIEQGDYFNYATLSTISKTLQNVTLDYLDFAKWIFWERSAGELDYFLSQDTVIYLPNDENLMLQYANWHCYAKQANAAILGYALSQLAVIELEPHLIIEWKYIAAQQYTLLDDKDNSLKYWLELYNSGHYQEKSASWIIYWCSVYAKEHLPLLIVALNHSACLQPNTTEDLMYTIPRFSTTTIARLVKLNKDDYTPEIADFISWALTENWNYRQILLSLLSDEDSNHLLRLYRHAIMLRHGNEILLQEILEEDSDNAFELFIIQNLQRQAKQYLEWITKLEPIQQFKTWLYDNDENASIPDEWNPEIENNQFVFARLWLDRFRHLPFVSKSHLYYYISYSQMEMFDWLVFFAMRIGYDFPNPPYANDRDTYWQWYRYCMLVIALANNPAKIAAYIKQNNSTFNIPDDSPIIPVVNAITQSNWQNENELYNAINNDNKMINCMLLNFPNSIESVIDSDPEQIDFYDIQQNIAKLWKLKLANHNPVYLMLLLTILLYKSSQTEKLHRILGKIADDNQELQTIANRFAKHRNLPFTFDRKKYHYNESVDKLKKLADRLSHYYGVCNNDELKMLIAFKDNSDNDLVLRLCAALLLAKDANNKNELTSTPLPKNKACQFWRWHGRANETGFLLQLFFSYFLYRFNKLFIVNSQNPIAIILGAIVLINIIFAIKRRLNDHYNGDRFFFIKRIMYLPLLFYPCWGSGLPYANRYGAPIERKKPKS
ncbi:hypothetical protein A9G13_08275 [Gilliamella sp. wkB178]|uniref:J domain-containing protein n=1 Tax=Gilliamella sp. wkB178 TaxID=3120259 RepID=UPI00080DD550|nr:J domain-containing protein [Gilliamella apicola]OCG06973.1 hypothetical protein A9G13_08275 [Gilliamella apicola]